MSSPRNSVDAHTSGGKALLSNMQILRGLAALMVIVSHLIREADLRNLADPGFTALKRLQMPWASGVDIFFTISGFLMLYLTWNHFQVRGYRLEFLKRRLIRVAPLYWIFTLVFVLIAWTLPSLIQHNQITPQAVMTAILFIPWQRPDGGIYPVLALGWTLNYEILFYLCFALVLGLRRHCAIATLLTVFVTASLYNVIGSPAWFPIRFWTNPIILEFILGMLIAWLYLRSLRLAPWMRVVLALSGFALLGATGLAGLADTETTTSPLPRSIWAGIPCALIVAGAMLGSQIKVASRFTRLLILGGDASYALYLTHMFPIRALSLAWKALQVHNASAFVLVGTLLAVAVAVGVFRYIESPLLKRLRKRFEPARGSVPA